MELKMEPMKRFLAALGDTAGWYRYAVRRNKFYITPTAARDIDLDNSDRGLFKAVEMIMEDMAIFTADHDDPDLPSLDWMKLDEWKEWVEAHPNFEYYPNTSGYLLGMPYGWAATLHGTPSPPSTTASSDSSFEETSNAVDLVSNRQTSSDGNPSDGRQTIVHIKRFLEMLGDSAGAYQYAIIGKLLHVMPLTMPDGEYSTFNRDPVLDEAIWEVIDDIAVVECDYYERDLAKNNFMKLHDFKEWVESHPTFDYDHNTTGPLPPGDVDGWAGAFLDTPSPESSAAGADPPPEDSPTSTG